MERRSFLKAFAASVGLSAVPSSPPVIAAAPVLSTNGAPATIAEMLSRCESIGDWFPVATVLEFEGATVLVDGTATPALTYAAFGWTEAEAVASLWEVLTDVLRGNERPIVYWLRYPTLKTVSAREEYRDDGDYLVHPSNPYFVASMRLTTTPLPKRTPYLKVEGEIPARVSTLR